MGKGEKGIKERREIKGTRGVKERRGDNGHIQAV